MGPKGLTPIVGNEQWLTICISLLCVIRSGLFSMATVMVMRSVLFKETLKALMVGGIIYYTYKEGLWSDGFRSSCFLGKFIEKCPVEEDDDVITNEFADLTKVVLEEPEPCTPFIPQAGVMLYNLEYAWNQIVIFTFWFILDAPLEMLYALLSLFKSKPKPIPPQECSS